MKALEFILRMRDEASARLDAFRSKLREAGSDSKKTVPELGEAGNKVAEISGGFARAREAIMRVVGLGGMIAGVFTTAYRAALPVGEYIRRMWDPVERGAYNLRKMQDQIDKTASATRQALEDQRKAVERIAAQYDAALASSARYYDSIRKARAVEGTTLSPDEAMLNAGQASGEASMRQNQVAGLRQMLDSARSRQIENAARFPKQITDPEKLQDFLTSNAVIKKEIDELSKLLSAAMTDSVYAAHEAQRAMSEYSQARVNEARAEVTQQKEELELRRQRRLDDIEARRLTVSGRLDSEKSKADTAFAEWRDPEIRKNRLATEKSDAEARAQYEQERRDLVERYGISIWGRKTLDESRLSKSTLDGMTDRERSTLEVMRAESAKTSDEQTLKSIDTEIKGLRKELQDNLRMSK